MSAGAPLIRPDQLREIGLFGGLDEATLETLGENLPVSRVEIGEVVVREGESSQEMFIVLGGELEIIKHGPSGGEVRVALIGPNDWFGEMTILDVQPRSATVRAVAPTLLLRLSAEHVERYLYRRDLRAYSIFLMNIARELSRRLRVADKIIAQVVTSIHGLSGDPKARRPIAD